MFLHLMRHGEANPVTVDPEKGLSEKGILVTKKIADSLKKKNIHLDIIYTSFKKRALQTSEIMQKALGEPKIVSLQILDPNEDPIQILEYLKENQELKTVLIVGHLPFLENLAALLSNTENLIKFNNSDFATFRSMDFNNYKFEFIELIQS